MWAAELELEGGKEGGEGGHVGAGGLELEGRRGHRSSVARKMDLEGGTTDMIGSGGSRPARGKRMEVMGSGRTGASGSEEGGNV